MSMLGVNNILAAYQYANKAQKNNAAGKTTFADTVKHTAENSSASREEQYVEYLKQRYGANVMVKNIGNDQRSIDNFGASIAGYNNVAIAPNILEKMANDPEKAAQKRREQTGLQYRKQLMEDALKKSGLDTTLNYHFISRSQVSAAAMAYESAIGACSSDVLGNT